MSQERPRPILGLVALGAFVLLLLGAILSAFGVDEPWVKAILVVGGGVFLTLLAANRYLTNRNLRARGEPLENSITRRVPPAP